MLGTRAIGSRARGLSPRTGDLAVDSPCPPLLSKRERCRLSQVSALCKLCSCLSTSGWWGGHPVNTYPAGTRFGTPPALSTLCSLFTRGRWGGRPMNTYPVGTRFGTPPAPCTLSSVLRASSCHQGPRIPTVGVRRSDKTPRDAMLGGGLFRVVETRGWAPFPGYPLARGPRRSPAAPPPPPQKKVEKAHQAAAPLLKVPAEAHPLFVSLASEAAREWPRTTESDGPDGHDPRRCRRRREPLGKVLSGGGSKTTAIPRVSAATCRVDRQDPSGQGCREMVVLCCVTVTVAVPVC